MFVVEDGTGKADANSLASVEFADNYFQLRGRSGSDSGWGCLDVKERQAALVRATDTLESDYNWITGEVSTLEQALSWPRSGAEDKNGNSFDSDEVPRQVKEAVCLLAWEFGVNAVDPSAPVDRVTSREKAGPVEVEYREGGSARTVYPAIDGLLRGLASSVSGSAWTRIIRG